MNHKQRIKIKTLYYIIGIIIIAFITTNFTHILGLIGFAYVICGSVISIALKLPLLSGNMFSVDRSNYNNIDTFINVLITILTIVSMIYLYII